MSGYVDLRGLFEIAIYPYLIALVELQHKRSNESKEFWSEKEMGEILTT